MANFGTGADSSLFASNVSASAAPATATELWTAAGNRAADLHADSPPTVSGYRITRQIGAGGMGAVYEAERERPRQVVALKLLRPGILAGQRAAEILRRFEQEANILARLHHPGIAYVYEAGVVPTPAGPQPFFALELVDGPNLIQFAAEKRLSLAQRLEMLARTADAVHHAHERNVIHRDLKPGNILVAPDGQPKILDFGVARVTDGDVALTTVHQDIPRIIGTLPYMSPEQATGDLASIDRRCDVYALGVILFELLTGRLPHDLRDKPIAAALEAIRQQEPQRISTLDAALRGEIETIVRKALAKDRGQRYPTAAQLAADLRRYLRDEPIAARRPSVWYRASKFTRRNRGIVGAATAVCLTLAAGLAGTTHYMFAARTHATDAQTAAQRADREAGEARAAKRLAEQRLHESYAHAMRRAAERGQWEEVLTHCGVLLAANHGDELELRLFRVQALDGLARYEECHAEVERLAARSDLGEREGRVRLWRGEALLQDLTTREDGVEELQAARKCGLSAPDDAYARGLLAETIPEALAAFDEAVRLDQYHLAAQCMRGAFAILLGQKERAALHLAEAQALFPNDPSLRVLRAFYCTAAGDEAGLARALLDLRGRLRPDQVERLRVGCQTVLQATRVANSAMPSYGAGMQVNDGHPTVLSEMPALLDYVSEAAGVDLATIDAPEQLRAALVGKPLPPAMFNLLAPLTQFLKFELKLQTATMADVDYMVDCAERQQFVYFYLLAATLAADLGDEDRAADCLLRAAEMPGIIDVRRLTLLGSVAFQAASVASRANDTPERRSRLLRAVEKLLATTTMTPGEAIGVAVAASLVDPVLASRALAVAERGAPDDRDVIAWRAQIELNLGAFGNALAAAERVLARWPEDARAQQVRRTALAQIENLSAAAKMKASTDAASPAP